jgi:hypothetical protein
MRLIEDKSSFLNSSGQTKEGKVNATLGSIHGSVQQVAQDEIVIEASGNMMFHNDYRSSNRNS